MGCFYVVLVFVGIEEITGRAGLLCVYAEVSSFFYHLRSNGFDFIFDFAKKFRKSKYYKPLVCVPSTYSSTHENELIKHGFKIVIYANQLLRSAFPAMLKTAKKILEDKRSFGTEKNLISIKKILNLIL